MRTPIAFALLIAFLADSAPAHLTGPENQIKIRQGGKLFMSWNLNRISDLTGNKNVPYDQEAVVKAAQVVAAFANSSWWSLYGPGTERSVGETKTRVKPEFFQQPDEVRLLTRNLAAEAIELARLAALGDQSAIRAQLNKTNEICKSCHDKFRAKA